MDGYRVAPLTGGRLTGPYCIEVVLILFRFFAARARNRRIVRPLPVSQRKQEHLQGGQHPYYVGSRGHDILHVQSDLGNDRALPIREFAQLVDAVNLPSLDYLGVRQVHGQPV